MSKYIILVEAEVTADNKYDHWEDSTGDQYHYPNNYKNKVQPDTQFIYYKTALRKDGSKGDAGYFGYGVIGDVYLDERTKDLPKRDYKWYCEINEYSEFKNLLLARKNKVGIYESIEDNRDWGRGVREISEDIYNKILKDAGIGIKLSSDYKTSEFQKKNKELKLSSDSLFIPKSENPSKSSGTKFGKSTESKVIGDLAEDLVYNLLLKKQENGQIYNLENVASQKVGYDLQYKNIDGNIIGVEVKGTKLKKFRSIKITRNEWNKAQEMQENYHLYVVVDCKSDNPKYNYIENFNQYIMDQKASLIPVDYEILFKNEKIN